MGQINLAPLIYTTMDILLFYDINNTLENVCCEIVNDAEFTMHGVHDRISISTF